ncbi:MAG: 1,4-alpha-glucan branching protein GlgB [Spirochaetota bacterium]
MNNKRHLSTEEINKIVYAYHHDPFQVLGIRTCEDEGGVVIRAYFPDVEKAYVIDENYKKDIEMEKIHNAGLYEAYFPKRKKLFKYKLHKIYADGSEEKIIDPYSFMPVLSDFDLHLISEGNHHKTYEKLGAHIMEKDGVEGVHFAVWAPAAKRVSIVGDFNLWDGRKHPMRVRGTTGIWEIFIPEIKQGYKYKFEIKTQNDDILIKSDPHAFYSELRPKTASIIYDINGYEWTDTEWLQKRSISNHLEAPISVYEVHLGSWMRIPEEDNRYLSYKELAPKLAEYVKDMGYTHIELMPIQEHPFDGSWGYQVLGYFAPTSRFGEPKDFMYFVDYLHREGIGVILDWVPAHFPKDSHGLSYFDGTPVYEYADPRKGEHADWGTLVFDYGRYEVSNFLISSGLFWLDKYHLDGLRVDAVASMLYLDYGRKGGEWSPNQFGGNENLEAVNFIKKFNELVHKYHRGVMTIAEESTAWPGVTKPTYVGGLGFTFKWNMGWMNDTLEYIKRDPIYRKYHHDNISFGLVYAFSEHYMLVLSHDEVVHGKASMIGKMPGDEWQKFANLRAYFGFQFTHPGKKLNFMGNEIGQWREWSEARSLDWHLLDSPLNKKLQRYFRDLNYVYRNEPALHQFDYHWASFEWIDNHDYDNNVFSYIRRAKFSDDYLVVIVNFSPIPRHNYKVGVPDYRYFKEIFNSDSDIYGGSNVGNAGGVRSMQGEWQGRPCSLNLTLPPLGIIILKPQAL